jgi:hypothetical protein
MTNPVQLSTDEASDECLTPRYAVLPIVKHLKNRDFQTIWCPFDKDDSFFVRVLRDAGFIVQYSHIDDGVDFLTCRNVPDVDCIVSNPPFSKKTAILQRLFALDLPFAMILPLNTLQAKGRVDLFIDHGVEMLCFDARICFYTWGKLDRFPQNNRFPTAYFCRGVLPEKLMFEKLKMIQEPYNLEAML